MKEALCNIITELSKRHRRKNNVFYGCVEKRLQKSLDTYEKEINETYDFLTRRNEYRMMRKINRGVK